MTSSGVVSYTRFSSTRHYEKQPAPDGALISLWGAQAQTSIAPVKFRATTQMVLVPVTVTDRTGKTVSGLGPKDFTIFDDRAPQRIVPVRTEDAPSSIGLVLDTSGSMRYALDMAKEASEVFLNAANPEDEFQLLTVASRRSRIPSLVSRPTWTIWNMESGQCVREV